MQSIEARITAQRICVVVKLDMVAVSRTLTALEASGHVECKTCAVGAHKKLWALTPFGVETHNWILSVVLSNDLKMVADVRLADPDICLRVHRRMPANLNALET